MVSNITQQMEQLTIQDGAPLQRDQSLDARVAYIRQQIDNTNREPCIRALTRYIPRELGSIVQRYAQESLDLSAVRLLYPGEKSDVIRYTECMGALPIVLRDWSAVQVLDLTGFSFAHN